MLGLVFLALVSVYGQDSFPDVVLPRSIVAGGNNVLYHQVPDIELELVQISLANEGSREVVSNVNTGTYFTSRSLYTTELTVDEGLVDVDNVRYVIRYRNKGGVDNLWNEVDVRLEKEKALVLVETDKSVYKAGDDLLIRVLAMDRSYRSVVDRKKNPNGVGLTVVTTIKNPSGIKIGKLRSNVTRAGVAEARFSIGDTIGKYEVECEVIGNEDQKQPLGWGHVSFEVQNYVLPRYEMSVDFSKKFLSEEDDKEVDLLGNPVKPMITTVSVDYVYGQPMVGSLNVAAFYELKGDWIYNEQTDRYEEDHTYIELDSKSVENVKLANVEFELAELMDRYKEEKKEQEEDGHRFWGGNLPRVKIEVTIINDFNPSKNDVEEFFLDVIPSATAVFLGNSPKSRAYEFIAGEKDFTNNIVEFTVGLVDGTTGALVAAGRKTTTKLRKLAQMEGSSWNDEMRSKLNLTEHSNWDTPCDPSNPWTAVDGCVIEVTFEAGESSKQIKTSVPNDQIMDCCNVKHINDTWQARSESCCIQGVQFEVSDEAFKHMQESAGKLSAMCMSRAGGEEQLYVSVFSQSGDKLVLSGTSSFDPRLVASLKYVIVSNAGIITADDLEMSSASVASSETGYEWSVEVVPTHSIRYELGPEATVVVMAEVDNESSTSSSAEFTPSLELRNKLKVRFAEAERRPGRSVHLTLEHESLGGSSMDSESNPFIDAFIAASDKSVELLGPRTKIDWGMLKSALSKSGAKLDKPLTQIDERLIWDGNQCGHDDVSIIVGDMNNHAGVNFNETATPSEPVSCGYHYKRKLYNYCSGWYNSINEWDNEDMRYDDIMFGGGMIEDDMMVMEMADAAPQAMVARDSNAMEKSSSLRGSGGGGSSARAPPRIRKFFPETWIWEHVALDKVESMVDSNGIQTFSVELEQKLSPDTITTFQLNAWSMHSEHGLALQEEASELRVFKPVFVEFALPYAAVRLEEFKIQIETFNYYHIGVELDFKVTLEGMTVKAAPLELERDISSSTNSKTVLTAHMSIEAKSSKKFELSLIAVEYGEGAVEAQVVLDKFIGSDKSVGSILSDVTLLDDGIRKTLMVKPEGIPRTHISGVVVFVDADETQTVELDVPGAVGVVPGSMKVTLHGTGSAVGPDLLANLDKLLRVPYGCGEQNMLAITPNVGVALAYREAGKYTGDVRATIESNLQQGVQRQWNYMHDDASFSAFRQGPSGSLWLTAFVVRVFSDVSEFVYVDEEQIAKSVVWLLAHQRSTGGFPVVGELIHEELMGGGKAEKDEQKTSGKANSALTGFTVLALQNYMLKMKGDESRLSLKHKIENAISFMESQSSESRYDKMLRLRAKTGTLTEEEKLESSKRTAILEELLDLSHTVDSDFCWPFDLNEFDADKSKAIDVEMSGYALQILTELNDLGTALAVVRYLGRVRSSAGGGFVSTQDTIVALDGLSQFQRRLGGDETNEGEVMVSIPGIENSDFTITSFNNDVQQSILVSDDVEIMGSKISVQVKSTRDNSVCFLSLETKYNLAHGSESVVEDTSYNVTFVAEARRRLSSTFDAVSEDPEHEDEKSILTPSGYQICAAPKTSAEAKPGVMMLISVELFSGFHSVPLNPCPVQRCEYPSPNKVFLYLSELVDTFCTTIDVEEAFVVENRMPVGVRVEEYYNPRRGGVSYIAYPGYFKQKLITGNPVIIVQDKPQSGANGWTGLTLLSIMLSSTIYFFLE